MGGRNAFPAHLMLATNDHNKINKEKLMERMENEPRIKSAKLTPPKTLSEEARKEWRRLVKLYRELEENILCDLDINVLEIYCEAVVRHRKAMLEIKKSGEVYVTKTDPHNPKKNPWLGVATDAAMIVARYSGQLLCDPVGRAKAGIAKSKSGQSDPNADLFGD